MDASARHPICARTYVAIFLEPRKRTRNGFARNSAPKWRRANAGESRAALKADRRIAQPRGRDVIKTGECFSTRDAETINH